MSLKFKVVEHDEAVVVELNGKITIGEGDVKLREEVKRLLGGSTRNIILDLEKVKYIDSSGIGELVSCLTTITNAGGKLRLTKLHSKIYSLLQLTELVSVFDIYDSNTDAIQSF